MVVYGVLCLCVSVADLTDVIVNSCRYHRCLFGNDPRFSIRICCYMLVIVALSDDLVVCVSQRPRLAEADACTKSPTGIGVRVSLP